MPVPERKIDFDVRFKGETYHCSLKSKSAEWDEISVSWSATHSGRLPEYQFAEDQVMQDQVRAHIRGPWSSGVYPITWKEEPPSGEVGIAVILESPHEREYDPVSRAPLAPLNNVDSRCKFLRRIGEILDHVAADGVAIPEGDVVLCNPVPYQASLARLYSEPQPYPLDQVTKGVWRSIYRIHAVRADFRARLAICYRPALVINACTSRVQDRVHATLKALVSRGYLSAKLVRVFHPAKWDYRQTTLGSIRIDDPIRQRRFGMTQLTR